MKTTQTISASDLVTELARQGIQIWDESEQLRLRAPRGVLTASQRELLAERRDELIDWLRMNSWSPEATTSPKTKTRSRGQDRNEPFPLTDIQQAYYVGRSGCFELGKVSCHTYYEIETEDLDLERLTLAWRRLVERHDMLRAIILPDGRQKILERTPPYRIDALDLRDWCAEDVTPQLQAIRERMSHQVLPADRWPLFEIRATRIEDNRVILHLGFDLLIMDAVSMRILFQEWRRLYLDPSALLAPLEFSFRDYVLAEAEQRNSPLHRRAKAYWLGRLSKIMPPPELPLAVSPAAATSTHFKRRSARLEAPVWQRLKALASQFGLTPSVALLTAFAEIIARWSGSPRYTLNVTLVNRLPLSPDVNRMVGDFTSFIPLAIEYSASDSFELQAGVIQSQLCEDVEHSRFSGIQVARELTAHGGEGRVAYFPVVFTSLVGQGQNHGERPDNFWMGKVIHGISQTPQVWLDHQVVEQGDTVALNWDAVEELFPEGLLSEMFDEYVRILHRLSDSEAEWRRTGRRMPPTAQLEQRAAVNHTSAEVPDVLLHELFNSQALQRPNHPAIVSPNMVLTYGELSGRVNKLAHKLIEMGARRGHLVAVVMEKGWEQVVATLAILQSGAAYLPISSDTPKARLYELLEDAQVRLALTQSWNTRRIELPDSVARITVDVKDTAPMKESLLPRMQGPDDLAYVIYTSGSTGKPKGVMISHRAVVNTIFDINRRFDVGPADIALALSSLSFDLSVYDVFGTLAAGATIVIPEPGATRDPALLSGTIFSRNVTIWNSVPAQMEILTAYEEGRGGKLPESLRLAMLSGDWIPVSLPQRIRNLSGKVQVVSLGGATEASIWSIYHIVERVDPGANSIPYGKPLANQSFHVLDDSLNPRPVWVPGALYIGGMGLAQGYWRDEEKTAASFVIHPQTGDRLYRTGDIGRYLPNGEIEFLGREDTQVKIRGSRIELGEIESILLQHPKVSSAAIIATGAPSAERRLIAYVVPKTESAPPPGELRSFLKERLPDYMLPASFVFLASLPLTSNGKIDRKTLTRMSAENSLGSPAKGMLTGGFESRFAHIVARALDVDHVEPDQNLFDLGGDSLTMITIVNFLERELGFRLKIADLYHRPTISEILNCCQRLML
ncbi:MAG: amino acid adenylation domain-containing protein [Chloracidobacterium sp.]|nr:amino acid adenylation domain-containing protein [Chloracidobacterium sp.]